MGFLLGCLGENRTRAVTLVYLRLEVPGVEVEVEGHIGYLFFENLKLYFLIFFRSVPVPGYDGTTLRGPFVCAPPKYTRNNFKFYYLTSIKLPLPHYFY